MSDELRFITPKQLLEEAEPLPDNSQALPASELSWREIKKIEPRLGTLQKEIKVLTESVAADDRFCPNHFWYGYDDPEFAFKKQVEQLAGYCAEAPELRSRAAYDLVYDRLYKLLPDCQHPGIC